MKNKAGDEWYPFWIDKWLFGSTKFEFTPAERSVWIDLLTLSHKDGGYIRANENMPYPLLHLANLFVVPIELLNSTIKKAIENGKLQKMPDDSLFVLSHQKYELSKRHKRRLEKNRVEESREEGVQKTDTMSSKTDTIPNFTLKDVKNACYLNGIPENKAGAYFHHYNSQEWKKGNGQFISNLQSHTFERWDVKKKNWDFSREESPATGPKRGIDGLTARERYLEALERSSKNNG